MAFVVVICLAILDPKNGKLKLSTKTMKHKVKYYLVGFNLFVQLLISFINLILFNFFLRIKSITKSL